MSGMDLLAVLLIFGVIGILLLWTQGGGGAKR